MSTLWIDASAGAAGDMICAALLDAGGELEALTGALEPLPLGPWSLHTERVVRRGMAALHLVVEDPTPEVHPHRAWADIRALIEGADLPERARSRALAVFTRLAKAEARVHGTEVEAVRFHEVGALDSILDILGACLLLEQLHVDRIVATPLPLGGGTVKTAHGLLPVPVPAVRELLEGWPAAQDGRQGELVTPTGAALITTLAEPGPMPSMTPSSTGTGAGTRDPRDRANVLRVVLGEPAAAPLTDRVEVLEAQVDDMPGEWVPPCLDALLAAGALDAWATPVLMKKGRPGLLLGALAPPQLGDRVAEAMVRHATTFGVRRRTSSRTVLDRHSETVDTPFGPVRVKMGLWEDEVVQVAPEYEDCAAAALGAGVPFSQVHRAALLAWQEKP